MISISTGPTKASDLRNNTNRALSTINNSKDALTSFSTHSNSLQRKYITHKDTTETSRKQFPLPGEEALKYFGNTLT